MIILHADVTFRINPKDIMIYYPDPDDENFTLIKLSVTHPRMDIIDDDNNGELLGIVPAFTGVYQVTETPEEIDDLIWASKFGPPEK